MVFFRIVTFLVAAGVGMPTDPVSSRSTGEVRVRADSTAVAIVLNRDVPASTLTGTQIRRIFLLRTRFWKDGTRIIPVNLPAATEIRGTFSMIALGGPAQSFAGYWKNLYFHGTQPPEVLSSEQAVLLYVARTPGAVGYVSLKAVQDGKAPENVRVLIIRDDTGVEESTAQTLETNDVKP